MNLELVHGLFGVGGGVGVARVGANVLLPLVLAGILGVALSAEKNATKRA
jgi:hypothetical protein